MAKARGKIYAAAAAMLSCVCMTPALAHGATIAVDGDDLTADVGGCGLAENPCDTIQAGVDAAAPGDTVRVAPSAQPYAEAVVISTPDLRLVGPRENVPGAQRATVPELSSEAVVDAPDGVGAAIAVAASGVRVDGLFFAGSATAPAGAFAAIDFSADRGEARNNVVVDHSPGIALAGGHHLIARNLFAQEEASGGAYGVTAVLPVPGMAVRQNRFEGAGEAIVVAGGPRNEAIEVLDNTIAGVGGTGLGMRLDGPAAASSVRGNVVHGTGTGIAVRGADGLRIDRNAISATGTGIALELAPGGPASRDVSVIRNQVVGFGDPVLPGGAGLAVAEGALGTDLVVVANPFALPAAADAPAVLAAAQAAGTRVLAANNWWGCNGGADAPACTGVTGPDVVTTPWLVLSAATIPSDTPAPGAVRLSADVQRNSAGQDVAEVALLGPLPFAFAKVIGPGALSPPVSPGGGSAQSALESWVPGHAVVRASLDQASADVAAEFTTVAAPAVAPAFVDTPPWLRRVRFAPKTFSRSRGTAFAFELSEPAAVRVVLERMTKGRLSGGRCLRPRGKAREVKCIRRLGAGILVLPGAAGANQRPFAARVGKRRLAPGRYRATVTASDAAGKVSPAKRASFIVRPR